MITGQNPMLTAALAGAILMAYGCFAQAHDGPAREAELTVSQKTGIYLREKKAEREANLTKWRRVVSAPAPRPDLDRRVERAKQLRDRRRKKETP